MVLSGDLTDHGDRESFEGVGDLLEEVRCPILPLVGNHDTREGLLHAFPDCPRAEGFVQYAIEQAGLTIICLDTLEPGRHGGGSAPPGATGCAPGSTRRRASRC